MQQETKWMKNEAGDVIQADVSHVETFREQGYEICEAPAPPEPLVPDNPGLVLKEGQSLLWKGNDYCVCGENQVGTFLANGWSRKKEDSVEVNENPSEDGSGSNGGKQQHGDEVNQEHGRSEDGAESGLGGEQAQRE